MSFCNLSGNFFLVTGASSGIGAATALLISKLGGTVMLTGRNEGRLNKTRETLVGEGHRLFACDLTDQKEINQMVAHLPELNGIVHSAGIVGPTPVKFIRQENIDKLIRINFEVPVLLTSRILLMKKLKDQSSVVFLSTIATDFPYFGGALYNSAKAAIVSYSKTLALELVKKGIRSNCIAPGLVNTPLINQQQSEGQMELMDDSLERYKRKYPMGIGEALDVANAIVFLLSDESKWVSGATLKMGAVLQ